MAKNVLLETKTSNFLELVGNGKVYKVPPFQRDYSWKEEQWEDLWNDLLDTMKDDGARHYLGAIVLESESDREFRVIDGQQRLATLSVLALAVIKALSSIQGPDVESKKDQERALALRSRFIGEKDPASLVESSKLFLNETNGAFYQDYLVQLRAPQNPRGLDKSNKLLWDCFQYFLSKVNAYVTGNDRGERLASLLNESVARQLIFIVISVDDDLNAYTVFETLNARGLELTSTDLLKNYLFSRIRLASDLKVLQRRWQKLLATVTQERFPEFLRYHLLVQHRQVRRARLFKMVREVVRKPPDVFALMHALEARAELFAALSNPNHEFWVDRADCKPSIRELKLFGVRQMTPLLFTAWEQLSADRFRSVLRLVTVLAFRHTVIGGRNTNELEPVYHEAAKAVASGEAKSAQDVFAKLRIIYPDDESFRQVFAGAEIQTSGNRKRLAKYVLARLESDAAGTEVDFEETPATIEHIFPENPSDQCIEGVDDTRWESLIYRIGNLAFLEASMNRDIGNAVYSEKISTYAKSKYTLVRNVPEIAPEEWRRAQIESRQATLADRAVHLWRVDYE